ncbi:recombinase zinc beta ribbon domain-containing protein [Bradyrhizobium sp. CCGE-LA001]|uniref:recombinase zinc beta ribbon domain-containing protein n=1 Tax=Bradyrhizobium sp. CCGE-LA001 TaxID=1223566 RepID=UPI0003100B7E|nr:recombinase zinc beta ribbon domain-containing protein [Bradyrhizobium sp. CCGE-LA001]AMA60193.1 hypothetical protein BCCGELA001_30865 [Bradyrhizobium sp. CCGE-LA001]
MTVDAEHLRIIDADSCTRARARREDRGGPSGTYATRPKHILSGLLNCGCCGAGYDVVGGNDKRGPLLPCTRVKETGLCDNRRYVSRLAITNVLKGIEENLASPVLIAEYVREYHRVHANCTVQRPTTAATSQNGWAMST